MVAFSSLRLSAVALSSAAVLSVLATPITSDPSNQGHVHQLPLTPSSLLSSSLAGAHPVNPSILSALSQYPDDPLLALLALKPELSQFLEEARLLRIFGDESTRNGVWMTEGDKLRLRKEGKGFMDLTERFNAGTLQGEMESLMVAKANTPNLTHQRLIRPIFSDLETPNMHRVLAAMTSFYNRFYMSESGVASSQWLHNEISSIIRSAPLSTHISLEVHTHRFPQSSIIARFEPPIRNASLPLTVIGAHQDSANYLFPLLPAPGADDDMSGSTSILEAFRALAGRGYIPKDGPVEFHWYAAEEAGLLGSQEIVAYKKGQGAKVGAMMEFDMTAFVARDKEPSIVFLKNDADSVLTDWVVKLAKEYIDLPVIVSALQPGAGSDYMSWTAGGYPSAFAAEGDPLDDAFDPYLHTSRDRMDVDDERGTFSLEHMKEFSKLAVAFAVEQAGWSPKYTREDDKDRKFTW